MSVPRGLSAAALLLFPLSAAAAEPLTATGSSATVGAEVSFFERSLGLAGTDLNVDGPMAGVYGYLQRGAGLRLSGRLLGGSLDVERGAIDDDESAVFGELRGTLGMELGSQGRLYTGVGAEQLSMDVGSGEWDSWSIYVPIGYSKADQISSGWYALVSVEGRLVFDGAEEFDGVARVGNLDFDRSGGFGARISGRFRNPAEGIEVQPFIELMRPDDTDRESGVRVEDIDNTVVGVRFTWVL